MNNGKPVYKLIDGKGRVLIPKELRAAAGLDYGDIVRLGVANGKVSVRKVDIIEVGQAEPACKSRVEICKVPLCCCSRRGRCGNLKPRIYRRESTARAPRRAAFKTMPDDTRLSLITELTGLLRQKKEV